VQLRATFELRFSAGNGRAELIPGPSLSDEGRGVGGEEWKMVFDRLDFSAGNDPLLSPLSPLPTTGNGAERVKAKEQRFLYSTLYPVERSEIPRIGKP
jgi:hypothetical protein